MDKEALDLQETLDAAAVCSAVRRVLEEKDITSEEVCRLTGIPASTVRRMTRNQEPKLSQIVRIERALGVEIGTVIRLASKFSTDGLIQVSNIVELLANDPQLHPLLRRSAVQDYESRVRISADAEVENR